MAKTVFKKVDCNVFSGISRRRMQTLCSVTANQNLANSVQKSKSKTPFFNKKTKRSEHAGYNILR
jgi:hypothetical protein